MQQMLGRLVWATRIALVVIIAGACATDLPMGAASVDPVFARAAAYTSLDIGAQLGNYSSDAKGVNDAGDVAGSRCCGSGSGAFARVAGTVTSLGGEGSAALAISNGTPLYVAGYAGSPSQPVRWSVGQSVEATYLPLLADETFGAARGVNDLADAVGNAGIRAAIWSGAGVRTSVPTPDGYVRGEGRGINNAGHAVFVFFAAGSEGGVARGYLRLASGDLIELPPESGDVTTYANDISEVVDGAVYVAGTSRTSPYAFRSVRWTVDVTTGQILTTAVRAEMSHGLAVSNVGAVAGFLETNAMHTPRFDAYLWRGTQLLKLNPPGGGKNGRAWAASQSGQFVAGEAVFGVSRHAVLWTILSP